MGEDINSPTNGSLKSNSEMIIVKKSTYKTLTISVIISICIAAFLGGYSITNSAPQDYVTDEDLNAAISELEYKIENMQPTNAQPTQQFPKSPAVRVSLDDDPFKGDPHAPVTIVEFSDFQCPFCSRFYHQTLPQLEQNYIDTGKVKFVYRDLPLDNLHPNARPAHIAAECADEQGKFWQYHDVLFENQSEWNDLPSTVLQNTFSQYANDLGLQSTKFDSCLESQDIAKEVNEDSLDGAKYGATGTPTFFIGNEEEGFTKLVGAQPYSTFQNAINSRLG